MFLQEREVIGDGFRQVPGRRERHILADAAVARRIEQLDDERFALGELDLRRFHRVHERLRDAVHHHALHVQVAFRLRLQLGAVDLANAMPRESVEHEQAVGLVDARELLACLRVHPLRQRHRIARPHLRISHLDHRDGAPAPGGVFRAVYIGIGHIGNLEQAPANLLGVHVLAARHEHVVGAFLDGDRAALHDGGIAGEEESVGRGGELRADVAPEHAGTADPQLAAPVVIGIDHARIVARQQEQHAAIVFVDGAKRHEARGLGHTIARHHRRLELLRERDGLGVRRCATEQDAAVRTQRVNAAMHALLRPFQQVTQGFVDHRNVRRAKALRVGEHAVGIETAVEQKWRAVEDGAHDHLEAADVVQRQAHLPRHILPTAEQAVEGKRGIDDVAGRKLRALGATGRARREHDDGLVGLMRERRSPLRAVHELAAGLLLAGQGDHLVHIGLGEQHRRDAVRLLDRGESLVFLLFLQAMVERDEPEAAIPARQDEEHEFRAVVHIARDKAAAPHALACHLVHQRDSRNTRLTIGDADLAAALPVRPAIREPEEHRITLASHRIFKRPNQDHAPNSNTNQAIPFHPMVNPQPAHPTNILPPSKCFRTPPQPDETVLLFFPESRTLYWGMHLKRLEVG